MTQRRLVSIRAALLLCVPLAIIAGCGGDASSNVVEEVRFEVIPEYLDEVSRQAALGVEFRPPLGWRPLDEEQRSRVAAALLAEHDDDRFNLQIVDVFLHTETLSFAALSTVSRAGEPITEPDAYVESFSEALGPDDDDEIRARGVIRVNDLDVTQFRHTLGDRITFTLVFRTPEGSVAQLDYSIPVSAYENEGIKLESSIGTLHAIAQEQS